MQNELNLIKKFMVAAQSSEVVCGIGDDSSLLKLSGEDLVAQSTDLLIEDIHFRVGGIAWQDLGYKALAVNVSDIVAMGGIPRWAHLSCAFPQRVSDVEIEQFAQGFHRLAQELNMDLVGGDTCRSPGPVFINVHLTGVVEPDLVKLRSGFADADFLAVSGSLGDSRLGLICQEQKISCSGSAQLLRAHHRPPVEVEIAKFLAPFAQVCALTDISDGLANDLQKIPSRGFQIAVDAIPVSETAKKFCAEQGLDPYQIAVGGGEDYRLLIGLKKQGLETLQKAFQEQFDRPLVIIGQRVGDEEVQFTFQGRPWQLNLESFNHF